MYLQSSEQSWHYIDYMNQSQQGVTVPWQPTEPPHFTAGGGMLLGEGRERAVMGTEKIRESVIAGTWYPGNAQKLSKEIEGYLDQAKTPTLNGEVVALIAPHAGYMYSGGVAAYAWTPREQPFDRVLIVAPSHRTYFEGASVYSQGGFRTPLGVVPLDRELLEQLLRQPAAINDLPEAHSQEHSLEIQLPFLQVVLKEFQLTPLVMGEQSYANCQSLATAIAAACQNKRVLLVASSDLSHYHAYQEAKTLDQLVLDAVSAYDPKALDEQLRKGNCEACGAGPIMTVMLAARQLGANQAKVLHYANSGDVTGDRRGVVKSSTQFCTAIREARERPKFPKSQGLGSIRGFLSKKKRSCSRLRAMRFCTGY